MRHADADQTPGSADTRADEFDSIDYCINFWEGAIDNEEDAELAMRGLNTARHIRAFDDLA
ncbi:MAG: hypothetical protein ACJ8F7_19650 [Gemmataceae bacterium]